MYQVNFSFYDHTVIPASIGPVALKYGNIRIIDEKAFISFTVANNLNAHESSDLFYCRVNLTLQLDHPSSLVNLKFVTEQINSNKLNLTAATMDVLDSSEDLVFSIDLRELDEDVEMRECVVKAGKAPCVTVDYTDTQIKCIYDNKILDKMLQNDNQLPKNYASFALTLTKIKE